jgi:lysine decarboxylase
MSGLAPRFVEPTIDPIHGIAHGVTPASIDAELRRAADAGVMVAAVAIVSPSYFGAVADVQGIAEVSHRHGVPLIVDASWGAHFGFHPEFPASPTILGADIVVSSVHKLGGSLTQTALLHVTAGEHGAELQSQLERAFRLTESTSPSSLLLASLDIARAELASNTAGLEAAVDAARTARELIGRSTLLRLPDADFLSHPDVIAVDPLHVAIDVRELGLSGITVKSRLAKDHGVFVEIAAETSIVALIGAGQRAQAAVLIDALERIASSSQPPVHGANPLPQPAPPAAGEAVMTPREAYLAPSELVPAADAVGRVSADLLAAYPPGIPNVVPGERITRDAVDFLRAVATRPAGYVRGAADPLVQQMRVLRADG